MIEKIERSKFRILLNQKDSSKQYSILVDKSANIKYDELISYLESKIQSV